MYLTFDLFSYTQKGLLNMVLRNSKIKDRPQRFQDCKDEFDIIITFEDRVFDIVCEGPFNSSEPPTSRECVLTSRARELVVFQS